MCRNLNPLREGKISRRGVREGVLRGSRTGIRGGGEGSSGNTDGGSGSREEVGAVGGEGWGG